MSPKERPIEVIARAVIFKGGRVLLVRKKGAGNTFLPGGHIDWCEPARRALRRELVEELGRILRVGRFLGNVEHRFGRGGGRTHELNFLFLVQGQGLPERVLSRESKLEFFWHPARDLKSINLQPAPLQKLVPALRKNSKPVWASTME